MTEPPTSNLTRSLSSFKSKISSKFKNGNAVDLTDSSIDESVLMAMKYDDLPAADEEKSSAEIVEIRPSRSYTNLSLVDNSVAAAATAAANGEAAPMNDSRNSSIVSENFNYLEPSNSANDLINDTTQRDNLLPPVSIPPNMTMDSSPSSSMNSTPSTKLQFSIKEQEFSFLQLQQSSNPTSPVVSRRNDSIIDPLNSINLVEKLNATISNATTSTPSSNEILSNSIISPQPSNSSIPTPLTQQLSNINNSRRKSSNISTNSNMIPPPNQPATPTNEVPLNKSLEIQSLELADAMALSILDKVDEIKIDQGNVNTDEWKI